MERALAQGTPGMSDRGEDAGTRTPGMSYGEKDVGTYKVLWERTMEMD